jgi:hypothetical protein
MQCPHCGKEVFLSLTIGDEPATPRQLDYIHKIAYEQNVIVNPPKTKAEASKLIDQLTGKGGAK